VADAAFKGAYEKFSKPAPKEAVDKAVKALQDKKHTVKVVDSEKDALEYIKSLLKEGQSISMGTSQTLQEIGLIEWLKENDAKYNNLKGKAAAAAMAGNMAEHAKLLNQGFLADTYLSSVSAVSQEGDIFSADLTGTRIGGYLTAGQLIIVLGSNKIVANEAEAEKRLWDYQLKVESARVRVAYGVPASAVINKIAIRSSNPFHSRITVVIVNKSLGF
jgi:hypothetical protein